MVKKEICNVDNKGVRVLGEMSKFPPKEIHIYLNGLDITKIVNLDSVMIEWDNGKNPLIEEIKKQTWRDKICRLMK